ncbi:unnamed protein product [Adineta steineri]|uniref:Uncharacterized protein n=1 Tax=Adineta steineri TaxID=433720 RepID=A0A814IVG0_9BILA|nr:unnamed protein product [Adineta steineri]
MLLLLKIYLGESDSQDSTLKFLQKWALNDPKHVDIYTAGNQQWKLYVKILDYILDKHHSLIKLKSAFGGAAIYNEKYLSEECLCNGWMDHGFWFYRQQCVKRKAGDGNFFINTMFETIPVQEIRRKKSLRLNRKNL